MTHAWGPPRHPSSHPAAGRSLLVDGLTLGILLRPAPWEARAYGPSWYRDGSHHLETSQPVPWYLCVLLGVCVCGGRCLDAGVGPDARLCPQGLAQRGCSQDVLGRESRREGRRRGGKEGGREGSWEEMHDSWAAVEPSRRAGKGAACSAVGGCETLRLKQAVDTPASSGPPRSLGKGVSHRQGPSFATACRPGLSPWL